MEELLQQQLNHPRLLIQQRYQQPEALPKPVTEKAAQVAPGKAPNKRLL